MSREIDEKVLSMQFDNAKFEKNVHTSLGTIDKLKQALNFTGATKGLDNLGTAARNVNMNPLSNSVEAVSVKFSALQVAAVTAFANITNQAVNAGKRVVKAFTLDPVTTGFQEYETQLNAVQTILANTSHQGTTLTEVNAALDELNTYADRTIYNFTEMTRNIGTFTAAGLDLKTSTEAIKGIANLAAMSGSTSQQASTAMYQLSQALAAGRVSLQDWNSVVNAGMGGKVFQDALVRTAAAMKGVSVEAFAAANGTDVFRESISNTGTGWLTTEVLSNTLRQFTGDLTEAELAAIGFTEEQIKSIQSMATTANDAATKVKTFTMLMDTLKEAVQSGWAQTWELIFGDFEEAKAFWTELSDDLGGALQQFSDARNELLGDALGKPASEWTELSARIEEAGISMEDFRTELIATAEAHDVHNLEEMKRSEESLIAMLENGEVSFNIITQTLNRMADAEGVLVDSNGQVVSSMEDLQNVVTSVIRGDFGNGIERIESLTDANYDAASVQNLVNTLWERNGHTWADCTLTAEELSQAIGEMSDAELESIGFTQEQISGVRQLADELAAMDVDEWTASFKPTGRELLIDSIRNSLEALAIAFGTVKDAWTEVMPEFTSEDLYAIIEAIHSFTESIKMSEETADKVKRTFKGLFAILDIIGRVVGGVVKFAFKTLIGPLGLAGDGVLTMTSSVGDMIVAFRDWLVENDRLTRGIEYVGGIIVDCAAKVKEWIDAFLDLPLVQNGISNIKELFEDLQNVSLSDLVATIKEDLSNFSLFEVGRNMIAGLREGLANNEFSVLEFIFNLGRQLLDEIMEALDIRSPSREMRQVGEYTIQGLAEGIEEEADNTLWGKLEEIGEKIGEFFANFEWDKIAALGISGVLLAIGNKIVSIVENLSAPFEGVGSVLDGTGEVLEGVGDILQKSAGKIKKILNAVASVIKSFSHYINAIAFKEAAQGLKDVAIALGIMVAAVVVLSYIDEDAVDRLWDSVIIIGAIAAVLGVLAFVAAKAGDSAFSLSKDGLTISDTMGQLLKVALAIIALSAVVKILGDMGEDQYAQGMLGLIGMAGVIVAVIGAIKAINKDGPISEISDVTSIVWQIAAGMVVMALAAKIAASLDETGFNKAIGFMAAFLIVVYMVEELSRRLVLYNAKELATSILAISGAMILMAIAMRIVGGMEDDAFGKGILTIIAFGGLIAAMLAISKGYTPSDISKFGVTMVAFGGAMALMAITMRIIGGMDSREFAKGLITVFAFGALIVAMMVISNAYPPSSMMNLGGTLAAFGAAMILMAITMRIVGGMEPEELIKGIVAVGALGLIAAGLAILVSVFGKDAPKITLALLSLSIAVGILAAIAVVLGLIDEAALQKGINAVGELAIIAGLLTLASSLGGNDSSKSILALAAAIAVMAAAAAGLSFIDTGALWKAVGAVSVLMLVFGFAAAMAGTMDAGSFKSLIVMSAMLVILAISLKNLSDIHPQRLESAVNALGGVILALGVTLGIIGVALKQSSLSAILSLAVMTIVIGMLAEIVALLARSSGIDNATRASQALSLLLLSLAASCAILSLSKGLSLPALGTAIIIMALLTAVVWALGEIISGLATTNPQSVMGIAQALSSLLLALSACCVILNFVSPAALVALPTVGALTLVVWALSGILKGLSECDPTATLGIAKALSELLLAMSVCCVILGVVGLMGPGAFVGATALANLIVTMGAVIAGLGILVTYVPEMEEFINTGLPLLEKIGQGIGAFFGNMIGGFTSGLASGLPQMADDLSEFMENIKPFISGARGIDQEVVDGVAALAGMILALTAADILNSLGSILGDSSMEDFGDMLVDFAECMIEFNEILSGTTFDEGQVESVKNIGEMMTALADGIPNTGGFLGDLVGNNDIDDFGEMLVAFAGYMVDFNEELSGTTFNESQVQAVRNMGLMMTELADAIPNTGVSFASILLGDNSISDFGWELGNFASAMVNFNNILSGTEFNESQVQAVRNMGLMMTELANTIPNTGVSFASIFVGDNGISAFGDELVQFACDMVDFNEELAGTTFDSAAVNSAYYAGMMMAKLAESLTDVSGGWLSDLFGEVSLDDFGEQMEAFGESVADFADAIGDGISEDAVNSAANAGSIMAALAESLEDVDTGGYFDDGVLTAFGEELVAFGAALDDYYDEVDSIDTGHMSDVIEQTDSLFELIKDISEGNWSTLSFRQAVGNLGADALEDFIDAFASCYDRASEAVGEMFNTFNSILTAKVPSIRITGESLATAFVNGISSKTLAIAMRAGMIATSLVTALKLQYLSFYESGVYLVDGFAAGITAEAFMAEAAAAAMALSALEAAKEVLGIQSPSRVFMQFGRYVDEGFIIGMEQLSGAVSAASEGVGQSAVDGITATLSSLDGAINSDIDIQPTIRPVVDTNGLAMNELQLGNNLTAVLDRPVVSMAQLMADAQNQISASNQEVVSAVTGLRDDLTELFTDDGQEIALYVDSKKLATSLAKPMNRQLNILSQRGAY